MSGTGVSPGLGLESRQKFLTNGHKVSDKSTHNNVTFNK